MAARAGPELSWVRTAAARPDQLAHVLDRGDRVGGVLNRVERGDDVEPARLERQRVLEVADGKYRGGDALAGDIQQGRGGVQARHRGPAPRRQQQREA